MLENKHKKPNFKIKDTKLKQVIFKADNIGEKHKVEYNTVLFRNTEKDFVFQITVDIKETEQNEKVISVSMSVDIEKSENGKLETTPYIGLLATHSEIKEIIKSLTCRNNAILDIGVVQPSSILKNMVFIDIKDSKNKLDKLMKEINELNNEIEEGEKC